MFFYYLWTPISILLASPELISAERAEESAAEVSLAAMLEGQEEDANIAAVFLELESGGDPSVVGDHGAACSKMQMHPEAREGHPCAELIADSVLAIRIWMRQLRRLRGICGSTERALGALASGKCGGAPALVKYRCSLAGGCE